MILYSPAAIGKIRRNILTASDKTKARICRKLYIRIMEDGFIHFPEGHEKRFVDMYKSADFDHAMEYLHDIILPAMKKQNSIRYEACLHTIENALSHHEWRDPYNKDLIDQTWEKPELIQALLKRYDKEMKTYIFGSHQVDLLYWLESLLQRPAEEQPEGLKLCLFHLFTQAITNRENRCFARLNCEDSFLYYQEKYQCFEESDPRQIALLNFKISKEAFKSDWRNFLK